MMNSSIEFVKESLVLLNSEYVVIPHVTIEPRIEYLYGLAVCAIFLATIAFLRLSDYTLFKEILTGMFRYKNSENLLGTGFATLGHRFFLLLLSSLMISIGISYISTSSLLTYTTLFTFVAFIAAHYITIGIYKYLGWTFNNQQLAATASMNLWLSNISFGVISSPFILSLFFAHPTWHETLVKITLIITIILFIVRIFRWIRILFHNKVFILYMILYLCGLEIAPLILLITWVVQ